MAPENLFGIAVWFVLALALMKYTYAVINRTAEGHLNPPPVLEAFTGSGFSIVFLQLLVFVLMGGLVATAAMVGGPILMLLAIAFVILALPASIMVLAMDRSVGAAVNPATLAVLISRIGTPYFLLYGYLILLTLASGVAQDFALNHFPVWVSQPLSGFLNSTFSLILFNMLGYLLFQYREELGLGAADEEILEAQDNQHRDRSARFDADIDMNLKDGNYDRVQSMLKEALKRDRNNGLRLEQLYRLLMARNDVEELYRNHPQQRGRHGGTAGAVVQSGTRRVPPGRPGTVGPLCPGPLPAGTLPNGSAPAAGLPQALSGQRAAGTGLPAGGSGPGQWSAAMGQGHRFSYLCPEALQRTSRSRPGRSLPPDGNP